MGVIPKNLGAGLIAVLLVLVFGFMCVIVALTPLPEANKDYVTLLLNILSGQLGLLGGYLFRGASEKEPPKE